MHGCFKIMISLTIAQPFMAGKSAIVFSKSRQGRKKSTDVRTFLSSLAGLGAFPNREPSHKWLGYFQKPSTRPACQSGSLSGMTQTSRRRVAMTRQAVGEISMPIMLREFSSGRRTHGRDLRISMITIDSKSSTAAAASTIAHVSRFK